MNRTRGGHHRAFRRAIVVDQQKWQSNWRINVECICSSEHRTQSSLGWPRQRQEMLRKWCRDESDCDPLRNEPISQQLRIAHRFVLGEVQARAGRQVRPDFPHRRVETHVGDLARAIGGLHAKGLLMPVHQVRQALVCDLDTFGLAGRARSVDHIG